MTGSTKNNQLSVTRTHIAMGVFLASLVLLLVKLFTIQIINNGKYKSLALNQYMNSQTIPPKRGSIYSSDGSLLAGTQTHYLLFAEPKKFENKSEFIRQLADIFVELDLAINAAESSLSIDKPALFGSYFSRIESQIKPGLVWVALRHNVTPEERAIIMGKNIVGIGFEDEPVRYYPDGNIAAHVVGFVGSDNSGERIGYYGIEGGMNEELRGRPGRVYQEVDSLGRPILLGEYKRVEPVQGRDVVLTISKPIQYIVEDKIKKAVEKYDASSGTAIVMDPNTGSIMAMVNFPSFRQDDLVFEEDPKEPPHRRAREYKNFAIAKPYEPGSVMKPFTVGAAIDMGRVTPTTTFDDNGPVWYSGQKIDNWDYKHHGVQNIIQLLQKSNNIGAAWVGHTMGTSALYKSLSSLGFGTTYDIELEGEETGTVRNAKTWTDIDLANISFGQGVSATPLQVLNAFNTFANGGFLLQPKIVEKYIDDGKPVEVPTKAIKRVFAKETADTMVALLEKAVEGGEAKFFVKKDYRIAGKTGTAQIFIDNKYDPQKTNATFVGFMAGSRKFSMIIKLEQPRTSIYAAETAVPTWMEIADGLVKFFGLPPDKISN